jgi:hypothetical protein
MYYPYFRGKQFELLTIRETAPLLARSGFVPIIEPVKGSLSGLEKAIKAVCSAEGKAIIIVNPNFGDHAGNGADISALLRQQCAEEAGIAAGILLTAEMTVDDALALHEEHQAHRPVFVHAGFGEPQALAERLGKDLAATTHVFIEEHCRKLYRKHFEHSQRILLRDGFKRRKNADYPPVEIFSDLHATYEEEGVNAFGDFLTVGDDYSEGGGPAYAVAIHLTYIDAGKDDTMYVYHFLSTTNNTPTDPAGKFGQALDKLVARLDSGHSHLLESSAIGEFRELHAKGHFPGLGYAKKLSMKHHIETLAHYLF